MRIKLTMAALATLVSASTIMPETAIARHHVYRGHTSHHRSGCGSGNGAVGTVAGGIGGAVIGHAIVGGPVATVAGGVGGALLGRHLDKRHTRSRSRC